MTKDIAPSKKPLVSVVVDGYNVSRSLRTVKDTLEALKQQAFSLAGGPQEERPRTARKYGKGRSRQTHEITWTRTLSPRRVWLDV